MNKLRADYTGLLGVLALLVLCFSITTPHFFDRATFTTIANQVPALVIIAVGTTFVLLIGGIDLSVGSILGLSGAVLGELMIKANAPLPLAAAGCLAVGLACGLVNGIVSSGWRLPSFIVTLGMLEAARGGAHLVTNSQTVYMGSRIGGIADASLFGLSLPFLLAVMMVIGGQFTLSRTIFGRHLVAVGANEQATWLSGINPQRLKVIVFALSGACAALAAMVDTSRFQSADPNAGTGFELQAIAAVVIGGTSLMGGKGSVVGSFIGVLVIAVLGAGLAAAGVQDETKRLVTGTVIVLAVVLDRYRTRARESRDG